MYDITIIGAGPAGATLARMLSSQYKVLLVDKRNLNETNNFKREKCCGGLIAPDAQKVLAELGIGLPKNVLTGPQMFSVKSIDYDNDLERYYQRHYINVDREKFDRWLVSLVPEHVELVFDCIYKSYNQTDDYIELTLNKSGEDYIVNTKILIGADGAKSRVRMQSFFGYDMPEKYVSIQKWYHTDKISPHYTSIFDKDITDFYSWIIQKDNNLIVGTAIPIKNNTKEKFDLLVEKLNKHGYQLNKLIKSEGTLIMRTRKLKQINVAKGNVALIGEAAGFISPSSAEGISYGLKSASILATCLNKSFDSYCIEYKKKTRKLKINILIKNMKVSIMYNQYLRWLVMKTRVLSMKIKKFV